LNASLAIEHSVLRQPHGALGFRLEGDRHPEIALDAPYLAIPGQMASDQFVPLKPDPHEGDLRAPVRIEGDQMGEAT
jgi:hypothetical protein